MRWADLFSIEVPQELYEEIERQRMACDKITSSKVATTPTNNMHAHPYRYHQPGNNKLEQ